MGSLIKILILLSICVIFESCFSKQTSEFICEDKNCFTVIQNSPFTDDGNSGIYFIYGKEKKEDNFVHVRYSDAVFYYRWSKDTLIIRCPYWKLVEDKREKNFLFDFRNSFTEDEMDLYDKSKDKSQFYDSLFKDFTAVNTYELK